MKKNYNFSRAVKNPYLKRIIVSVKIGSVSDASKSFRCDAVVDSEASLMVLPTSWKDRLGSLETTRLIELETASGGSMKGEVCGPVRIQIEGFRSISSEVAFVEMNPADSDYEPLVGNIVLQQSQAAVDRLGSRLVPVKHMDLKVVPGPSLNSWDSIPNSLEELPTPHWHREELERRRCDADANPGAAIPWDDVRQRLRKTY
jgi:putative addiction module component (TIGR02574 family)